MGKVVMYGSVSLDGFITDENDQPGPLFTCARVVFGSGKRYVGSVDMLHLLEDPDVVIQGTPMLQMLSAAPLPEP